MSDQLTVKEWMNRFKTVIRPHINNAKSEYELEAMSSIAAEQSWSAIEGTKFFLSPELAVEACVEGMKLKVES